MKLFVWMKNRKKWTQIDIYINFIYISFCNHFSLKIKLKYIFLLNFEIIYLSPKLMEII